MLKKILLGLGVVVVGVLAIAALKSPEMKVSREIVVSASSEAIFPYINNTKLSYEWMPWADGDPGIQINFSGPTEGVGSTSSWNGKQMGVGRSEVVESEKNKVVRTQLIYTKPFEMSQLAELSLTPIDGGTKIIWSVTGKNSFLFRLMGIFVDCDQMIGGEFEKGLKKLKLLSEQK